MPSSEMEDQRFKVPPDNLIHLSIIHLPTKDKCNARCHESKGKSICSYNL